MSYAFAEAWVSTEDSGEGLAVVEMSAEQAESFLSVLGGLGKTIAPIAAQVLPVAAPILGTALGGPVGAMVGNFAGKAAGQALSGVGGGRGRPAPSRPGGPAPPPAPAAPAANELLAFLQNPQLLQSILGQVTGSGGTVPVGASGTPAPFGAFMNALSVLANQAASESETDESDESEDFPEYLQDGRGGLRCDPAVPEERAAVLLQQLREAPVYAPSDPGNWLVSATRM